MYHAALTSSNAIAKQMGSSEGDGSYSSFRGSPASEGILQFDLWGVTPSDRYDWNQLKDNIMQFDYVILFFWLLCLQPIRRRFWDSMNVLSRLRVTCILDEHLLENLWLQTSI